LAQTNRFKNRKVIGMEIGGQHVLLLCMANAAASNAEAAANGGPAAASCAPPEPAPADASA